MKFSIFFGGEVQIFVSLESSFVGSCLDLGEIFLKLWTYQRKLLRWKGFRSLFFLLSSVKAAEVHGCSSWILMLKKVVSVTHRQSTTKRTKHEIFKQKGRSFSKWTKKARQHGMISVEKDL